LWITTFEDDWTFIEFDPPEGNVWQVGTPSKTLFDSAYSAPYALMTDTARLISEPIKHSFILKGQRPWYANAIQRWVFGGYHKYQFDTLSGGYIEVSYNKGETWTNIVLDDTLDNIYLINHYYLIGDTLPNGINGFSGNQEEWEDKYIETIFHCTHTSAALVYSVWLRFTYINLGSNNPHEGWMIDNLIFEINAWCEYWDDGINDNPNNDLVKIYPNPASSEIFIAADIPISCESNIALFDINGKLILKKTDVQLETPINVNNLPNGVYFYKILNKQQFYTGKIVIKK